MKLGVDIDGCLADFNSAYVPFLVQYTGKDLFPEGYDPRCPPCWHYPPHFGYTKEEYDGSWKELAKRNDFWAKLGEEPGAYETIRRLDALSREGHMVYFITTRMGLECKRQTELWLAWRGMEYPTVLIASEKTPIMVSLKLDVYVDDRLETVNDAAKMIEECTVPMRAYLVTRSYNQTGRREDLLVVNSVADVLKKEGLWW